VEKKDFSVGDMVSWNSSGGTAQGKIEHVMRDGVLGIPKSKFSIRATKENPAVLIRIYRDGKPTETLVGHKMSTLRSSGMKKSYDYMSENDWQGLNERQTDQAESLCSIVEEYGQFDQSSNANGAHYGDGNNNPFKSDGLVCSSCIFYEEGMCHLVSGNIDPEGVCKLWIIPQESLTQKSNGEDMLTKFWGGKFLV
jgi:hypothetical protein